jgi:uncharacterized protein
MYIGVKELGRHDLRFREDFEPGTIEFRSAEFRQAGPLHAEVAAALDGEEIHLRGRLAGEFEISCARCLEPVRFDVRREFDLRYRFVGSIRSEDELKLSHEDLEVGFYRGDGLFLADAVAEQVNLELPVKALCSEECQGLCPDCGVNRNRERCQCNPHEADPRWSALAGWKAGSTGGNKS